MNKTQTALIIGASLLLASSAFFAHAALFRFSLEQFEDVVFLATTVSSGGSQFLLAAAILSIPFLYFIVTRMVPTQNTRQSLLFLGITLSSGILFWWLRLRYLKGILESAEVAAVQNSTPVDELRFEQFFAVGVVAGAVVYLILIKILQKQKPLE